MVLVGSSGEGSDDVFFALQLALLLSGFGYVNGETRHNSVFLRT